MDVERINREIAEAEEQFSYVEAHNEQSGNPYVLVALQTSMGHVYTLSIHFPDKYPYVMPYVKVRKPALRKDTYHMYENGNICYQHQTTWNPSRHNLTHVIARAAKWLNKYDIWKETGTWPGKEIRHGI